MEVENWKWCLHCNRCYLEGEFKVDEDPLMEEFQRMVCAKLKSPYDPLKVCPYPGCDGSLIGDSWDWNRVRDRHPTWPTTPERGVRYDIYEKF